MSDQPTPRPWWRIVVILLVLFVLLAVGLRFFLFQPRFVPNAELLAELASQELPDAPAPTPTDWPQWRGQERDGVANAEGLITDWQGGLKEEWRVPGGGGFSSFAVRDGFVWTMVQAGENEEHVIALDLATGETKWKYEHKRGRTFAYAGPRATPTIDGDRLFTVTSDGMLLCLGAKTGTEVWKKSIAGPSPPQWGYACSPLVEGGRVFVLTGGGSCVAAYGRVSGELVWSAQHDSLGYSSPLAVTFGGKRHLVCFTGTKVMGVGLSDGALLWERTWGTSYNVNAATPLVFHGRHEEREALYVFVSSGYGKGCALVRVAVEGDGFRADAVYESNELCCHFVSPVRVGEHIYGLDETRDLTCLEIRTGKVVWRHKGFQKGSLLRAGPYLIAQEEKGPVALLQADPEEYRELGRFRPRQVGPRSWSMPVLAEGRLLTRDERYIWCYKARR
jgi:outer membrane protein assembly factor BamB